MGIEPILQVYKTYVLTTKLCAKIKNSPANPLPTTSCDRRGSTLNAFLAKNVTCQKNMENTGVVHAVDNISFIKATVLMASDFHKHPLNNQVHHHVHFYLLFDIS